MAGRLRLWRPRLWFTPQLPIRQHAAWRPASRVRGRDLSILRTAGSDRQQPGIGFGGGPIVEQRTLAKPITFEGVGLHSGQHSVMTLFPSPPDTGIRFCRARDGLAGNKPAEGDAVSIRGQWNCVIDTTLSTVLAGPSPGPAGRWQQQLGFRLHRLGLVSLGSWLSGPTFATVEHLMAAFSGERIHNVLVVLSHDEIPVMDGSSAFFTKILRDPSSKCTSPNSRVQFIEVLRPVSVSAGGRTASIVPWESRDRAERRELEICVRIDFGDRIQSGAGGKQEFTFERSEFAATVASARTFCFEQDVEQMRRFGLAKGGSLENAVVFGRDGNVLNADGLRYEDEPARHKALDALGDLRLGGELVGRFESTLPGHALNHQLLTKMFSDPSNYRVEKAAAGEG